jgi:hypothetical protein
MLRWEWQASSSTRSVCLEEAKEEREEKRNDLQGRGAQRSLGCIDALRTDARFESRTSTNTDEARGLC